MNHQKTINKVAILLVNYNMPEMTDKLAEQIMRNTKFPHELFLLDNSPEPRGVSKYATDVPGKNLMLNGGIEYLWNKVKDRDDFDAYWFLCNDIVFDEGRDYLAEMANTFAKESEKYPVAYITPSYHYEGMELATPEYMKKKETKDIRPIVHVEWNAMLITKEFMKTFYPNGFGLRTKHAFHDAVTSYTAWKNGYAGLIMDNLSLLHIGNQAFIHHGGKTINGVFVPSKEGLADLLVSDMQLVIEDYHAQGIDFVKERERIHMHVDVLGKPEYYLEKRKPNTIEEMRNSIVYFFHKVRNKLK